MSELEYEEDNFGDDGRGDGECQYKDDAMFDASRRHRIMCASVLNKKERCKVGGYMVIAMRLNFACLG